MARNPFEQLQDLISEPRQAFEDVATLILKGIYPDSRRVRVFRGDGGIDSFTGSLGDFGEADVYQVKYFVTQWGDPQKQQIRDAYITARHSKDYQLKKWTLCVPVRLTKDDLRWFDEWKDKQDRTIELMDGDDLTAHLTHERCAEARNQLRRWGVIGLQASGIRFGATAFIQKERKDKSGLTATVFLRLDNNGDRSARNVKAVVAHSETHCVAQREHGDWQKCEQRLNPRSLRYLQTLNPGDGTVIMGIPICPTTVVPFCITLRLTADDCLPWTLSCTLTEEQITAAKPIPFHPASEGQAEITTSVKESKRFPPSSPLAKQLLDMILAHEVSEERGLTEVLTSPLSPAEALYIPNNNGSGGGAISINKRELRSAIDELVQLGWLASPQGDGGIHIYELIIDETHSLTAD